MKNSTVPIPYWLKKQLFRHFLLFTLLIIYFLFVNYGLLYGQSLQASVMQKQVKASITLNAEQQNIGKILEQIEQQTDYVFIYSDEVIDKKERRSIKVEDKPIDEVLDALLDTEKIEYQFYGNQIVLSTQKNKLKKIERSGGSNHYNNLQLQQ